MNQFLRMDLKGSVMIPSTSLVGAKNDDGYGTSNLIYITYDLRDFQGGEDWYFEFSVQGNAIETGWLYFGSY